MLLDPGDMSLHGTVQNGEARLEAGLSDKREGRYAGSQWYTPSLSHFWQDWGRREYPCAFARVRAVRLNVLLRQVSLLSPQNRPYTFRRSRLARFPCAYVCSPVTFPHVTRHGTARKAPLFCVGVASSGVPRALFRRGFPVCVHDGLPSSPPWCHTIRTDWRISVFPVRFDFCTSSWLV